jgi:hypothetical protein
MTVAERVNLNRNFKVVQGRLGTPPKAIRLDPDIVAGAGAWLSPDVRKSIEVLSAFLDSAVGRVAEEGEPTWEDAAWQ